MRDRGQIVGDTGIAWEDSRSAGGARNNPGTLGHMDNCRVLVATHYADRVFDWSFTSSAYLPQSWGNHREGRAVAKVPTREYQQLAPSGPPHWFPPNCSVRAYRYTDARFRLAVRTGS